MAFCDETASWVNEERAMDIVYLEQGFQHWTLFPVASS